VGVHGGVDVKFRFFSIHFVPIGGHNEQASIHSKQSG